VNSLLVILAAAPRAAVSDALAGLALALVLAAFGLFCIWTAVRGFGQDLRSWQLALQSRGWPEATATIVSSEVRVEGRGRRITFEPQVAYRYEAQGRSFTGTRLGFAPWLRELARDEAEAAVRAYPAGASVPVYVHPQRPEFAILERRPPRGQLGSAVIALVVLAVGVAVLVVSWSVAGSALLERSTG
jgi:Protein of unknown function (DUF3592)